MPEYKEINPNEVVIHGAIHYVVLFAGEERINNPLEDKESYTLKELIEASKCDCLTVLVESPLDGNVYRYNNYGVKETRIIGVLEGYA